MALIFENTHNNRRNHFFAIGIDNYNYEKNLKNPIRDINGLASVLHEGYFFQKNDTRFLKNEGATRSSILNQLLNYVNTLTSNDNLLIYYAGHGIKLKGFDSGYWIASDGKKDDHSTWISNNDVFEMISKMKAHHVMLIADSCFSGSFLVDIYRGGDILSLDEARSRYFLSSGFDELVSDGPPNKNSPFAEIIIEFFKSNKKPYFKASEIAKHVIDEYEKLEIEKTPVAARSMTREKKLGEFVFHRKNIDLDLSQIIIEGEPITQIQERALNKISKSKNRNVNAPLISEWESAIVLGPDILLDKETVEILYKLFVDGFIQGLVVSTKIRPEPIYFFKLLFNKGIEFIDKAKQSEIIKENYNLICVGFKTSSDDFKFLSRLNNFVTFLVDKYDVGFDHLSTFKHSNNKIILESSFRSYLSSFVPRDSKPGKELLIDNSTIFVNRERELEEFYSLSSRKVRAIKILGMPGIGKRAFIRTLRRSSNFNHYFEFNFLNSITNPYEIILALKDSLGVSLQGELNKELIISKKKIDKEVLKIFEKFDSIKSGIIVFYFPEVAYNQHDQNFYNPKLQNFFKHLIQRPSFSSNNNKVLFVCNEDISFGFDVDSIIEEVKLSSLDPQNIVALLSQEFNKKGKPGFAKAISDINLETIMKLFGGHPQIAKLFINYAIKFGISHILNNEEFRNKFDHHVKIKYLIEKLSFDPKIMEKIKLLSLFKGNISFDFIFSISSNPWTDINILVNKFLLEPINYKDGTVDYYMPELIRTYGIEISSEKDLQLNHHKIGQYFWDQADKFDQSESDQLANFISAYHHFSAIEDKEKLKLLALGFKEKFLEHARIFFSQREYEKSWKFYDIIYDTTEINHPYHLANYLEAETRLRNRDTTEEKYITALAQFPKDIFILTSYAYFLYSRSRYEEAKQKLEILEPDIFFPWKNHFKTNSLYPRVLNKLEEYDEADGYMDEWIKYLEKRIKNKEDGRPIRPELYVSQCVFYANFFLDRAEELTEKYISTYIFQYLSSKNHEYVRLAEFLRKKTKYSEKIIEDYFDILKQTKQDPLGVIKECIYYLSSKNDGDKNIEEVISFTKDRLGDKININLIESQKSDWTIDLFYIVLRYTETKFVTNLEEVKSGKLEIEEIEKLDDLLIKIEDFFNQPLNILHRYKHLNLAIKHFDFHFYRCRVDILKKIELVQLLKEVAELIRDNERTLEFLRKKRLGTIYLSGKHDAFYFKTAHRIFGLYKIYIEFKWIGDLELNDKINDSNHYSMGDFIREFRSNSNLLPKDEKVILLMNPMEESKYEKLGNQIITMSMPKNPTNIYFHDGLENLLTLDQDILKEYFHQLSDEDKAEAFLDEIDSKELEINENLLRRWICSDLVLYSQRSCLRNFEQLIHTLINTLEEL